MKVSEIYKLIKLSTQKGQDSKEVANRIFKDVQITKKAPLSKV